MKDKHSKKKAEMEKNGSVAVEGNHKKAAHANGNLSCLHIGKDCKYCKELRKLQIELVKLQEWIKHEGLRVVVLLKILLSSS